MNREGLKALIASNKQSLSLLDKQLSNLQELASEAQRASALNAAKEHPYFYGAVGDDQAPGIVMQNFQDSTEFDAAHPQIFSGTIRIQEDAPFVCTGIMACVRIGANNSYRQSSFRGLQQFFTNSGFYTAPRIGFTDMSSGRVLFQAETDNDNSVGGGVQRIATSVFDTARLFDVDFLANNIGDRHTGSYGEGNGPSSFFQLPADMLLPSSGVIRVDASPSYVIDRTEDRRVQAFRLFVALVGYKILGD